MLQDAFYLVYYTPLIAVLAVGLVALLRLVFRKRLGKLRPIRSMTAVTWLLVLSIGLTWFVSMAYLTVVTAQEIYDGLYRASYGFLDSVNNWGRLSDFYDSSYGRYGLQYERPDSLEYSMLDAISQYTSYAVYSGGEYQAYIGSKLIRDVEYPMETAVLFYDGQGNLLHSSEEDIMFFDYCTQEEWDAGMDSTRGLHYGWIDISEGKDAEDWQDDPYLRFRVYFANLHRLTGYGALRVTGVFDGCELKPVSMYYVTDTQIYQVVESTDQFSTQSEIYSYTISDVDRTGLLEWQLQFDHSAEYDGDDLVTVYIEDPEMWDYEGTPLAYDGEKYESLAALMEDLNFPSWDNRLYSESTTFRVMGRFDLNELLVFDGRQYADYAGFDYESGGEPPVEFVLVTAIRSHPLSCSVSALRNIYIITGLLALSLLLNVRGTIKKHLAAPLWELSEGMASGWGYLYHLRENPPKWEEPHELAEHYWETQDTLRMRKNEIERLNTALGYAKSAEQNRRQMTSNIAHELKTPLAVVHSYAEGLKEHIAEEKRDKYLDVILSETERMDRMVLEMLELSRLEAGKVKLSRDEFSLTALTQSVFDKLEMAAQGKDLQLEFVFPEQCILAADEGRIAQVIENFATNAIKYTPVGGHILVKIENGRSGTFFSIENESEPLSGEALGKVWDTFYRTDESRSGGGTGLGLAIAKNIIELHGGKCSVRNTKTGVEFSFTI